MAKASFNVTYDFPTVEPIIYEEALDCSFEPDFNGDLNSKINYFRVNQAQLNMYHEVLETRYDRHGKKSPTTELDQFKAANNIPADATVFVSEIEISTDLKQLCEAESLTDLT